MIMIIFITMKSRTPRGARRRKSHRNPPCSLLPARKMARLSEYPACRATSTAMIQQFVRFVSANIIDTASTRTVASEHTQCHGVRTASKVCLPRIARQCKFIFKWCLLHQGELEVGSKQNIRSTSVSPIESAGHPPHLL